MYVLLTLLAGGETQDVTDAENTCRVECVPMSTEDYVDLLVTTVAEIPGNF